MGTSSSSSSSSTALLASAAILSTLSASYLLWNSLEEKSKEGFLRRIHWLVARLRGVSKGVENKDINQQLDREQEQEKIVNSSNEIAETVEYNQGIAFENPWNLTRADVLEIMDSLLSSAVEADRKLEQTIKKLKISDSANLSQKKAVALVVESCTPLQKVRERVKSKFKVNESQMIQAIEKFKADDEELIKLEEKLGATKDSIGKKSRELLSISGKVSSEQSQKNEVIAK